MGTTYRTTSLTMVVIGDALPQGVVATLGDDRLFHRPSGTVADMGGDPGEWICVPKHVRDHFGDHDTDGFRMQKGASSKARLLELPDYMGSGPKPLAVWIERVRKDGSPHPLVANLRGVDLEGIRAAYAEHRARVEAADTASADA